MKKYRMLMAFFAIVLIFTMFSTVAYAGGGEDMPPEEPVCEPTPEASPTPAPTPTPNPFTPAGTGTVIDNATDADGKEFFTIMTPAENVFYLVIDRQRETENVYFLNAVTEADLMALAEIPETPAPTPVVTSPPAPTPEPVPEPEPEPEKGGGMGAFILIVAIVLIGGGAAWYFKVYRPKQQGAVSDDDYSEYEGEADEPWPGDEDAPPEDDGPPWYDDETPDGAQEDE